MTYLRTCASIAILACIGGPAVAQDPAAGLSDLVGARGSSGESQLETRGYRHIRTETSADSKYAYWWSESRRQCVSVRTSDGRFASIVDTLPVDCGMNSGGSASVSGGEVPQIFVGGNGDGEVTFSSNNCVAYYDSHGYRTRALPACSSAQLARADDGMARHRREQGMDGSTADHSGTVLNLVCYGEGHRPSYTVSNGYRWDYDQHKYVYGTETVQTTRDFDTQIQLQFHDRDGRIRLPSNMIPVIHAGGQDGWWTLTNLSMSADRITGEFRLNGSNKPRIEVDRRSGHIRISGRRDFSGTCDNIDEGQRRF